MAEYIEREAVMKKFADHVKRSNNGDFASTPTWNQAVQIVEDSPAADVRPVVRGKWITVKHPLYECSICGAVYQDVGYGFNYCPNCGARMECE